MKTHDRQVGKLIDVLSRRSDVAFERFVRALVHTHQDDLAILLDPNTAHDLIQARNSQLQANQQGMFNVNTSNNNLYGLIALIADVCV